MSDLLKFRLDQAIQNCTKAEQERDRVSGALRHHIEGMQVLTMVHDMIKEENLALRRALHSIARMPPPLGGQMGGSLVAKQAIAIANEAINTEPARALEPKPKPMTDAELELTDSADTEDE